MDSYTSIPDRKTLGRIFRPISVQTLEGEVATAQLSKLSDLREVLKNLGRDIQERSVLYRRNLGRLEQNILRIDNEILQGKEKREGDLTRVEIQKIQEQHSLQRHPQS